MLSYRYYALIPARFGNAGASAASDVTLTAALDSNLSYVSDTPDDNGISGITEV